MPAIELKLLMQKVATGASLTEDEIKDALETMMSGVATPVQMAAFLMALRVRGETIPEITGAAQLMRERMLPVEAPPNAVDIVGTGGDGHNTFNVSTCAAIVAAGAGIPIAKHGNRAVSSLSGASDVLTALGVKIDVSPIVISRSIAQAGVGFMWAPMHHSAMKHWAAARGELGIRTIFNLIGPLANPARVKRQIVGVFNAAWTEPVAEVLRNLGSEHAWVVHGSDGLDEITTTGRTRITELKDGEIRTFEVGPEDAGLPSATLADLKGGDASVNATAIRNLLAGEEGAFRDIVLLNAAAALIVGGKAADLREGAERAARAIDDGAAARALDTLVAVTNEAL
ncbi:anthranilate phosphoribosyltransferase [Hyphomicrobium sulfonivorans]|uniref:anthranilate phosphoribosyltransferase n=1 Tax=Hyphomicrobium sulfonivorans TaxID=121290 RepID=UPI00156E7E9E|nr:anthranilate phosphoribosyltransferase [Hyphomicrobium sulfonivorans]MBI1650719.1 anthranilate phosphoribosyltransferase [Hyphomicrobium sulfonivorans]NSL71923.1 anthranilate phosphoribosyltransferase [Hyphomicrobium sulfonivorans]